MTKTQANEPGFVLVQIEMAAASIAAMVDEWYRHPAVPNLPAISANLIQRRLDRFAAPIVPAPAYGAKALEWSEVREPCEACRYNHVISETSFGPYRIEWKGWKNYDGYTIYGPPRNADDKGEAWLDEGHDLPDAKRLAQADFERRILSCLSSAPVEEADAKADAAVAEVIAESNRRDVPDPHLRRVATTIPSEPEAKGEAGAGPVGEAVAWRWRHPSESSWAYTTDPEAAADLKEEGYEVEPIYARPGEMDRLTRERDVARECHSYALKLAKTAEAALAESEQNAQGLASDLAGTQAELAETRERLEKVEEALRNLVSEGKALKAFEFEIRDAVGNTNWTCFVQRIEAANAALSTQESSAALVGDGKEAAR